jgi:hypothetical protein
MPSDLTSSVKEKRKVVCDEVTQTADPILLPGQHACSHSSAICSSYSPPKMYIWRRARSIHVPCTFPVTKVGCFVFHSQHPC